MKLSNSLAAAGLVASLSANSAGCFSLKMDYVHGEHGETLVVPGELPRGGKACSMQEAGYRADTTHSKTMEENFEAIRTSVKTVFPQVSDPEKVVRNIAEACIEAPWLLDIPGVDGCNSSCINMWQATETGRITWKLSVKAAPDQAEICQKKVDECTDIKHWTRSGLSRTFFSKAADEKLGTGVDVDCGGQSDNLKMDEATGKWQKLVVSSLALQDMTKKEMRNRARNCAFLSLEATSASLDKCPNSFFPEIIPAEEANKLRKVLDVLDARKADTNDYVEFWRMPDAKDVNQGYVGRLLPKLQRCFISGKPDIQGN